LSAILLNGSIVHYEALGRGRPIVFLHGWVGSWRYWIPAMQVASTSFRAYALDLFGFGDTAHQPLHYTIDQQAMLLDQFLGEMGIGKVALVGHGLGALVGFQFIKQFPRSVDRILAVNCPLTYEAVNVRMRTAPLAELTSWLSNRSPEINVALAEASKTDPQALVASMASLQADTLFSDMSQVSMPCLFVYGQNDPAISLPSPEASASFPDMMHHMVLEDIGHFPMIEDPVRFNRLMTDFMALEPGLSPRDLQFKEEWRRRVR
jgi:pimeloyl-ACP methyl ester carboxylesterase